MADNGTNSNGILGVVIGAIIVLAVGGGILYATGAIDPRPTNVTIQQPAATPAPAPVQKEADRRDDRPDGWRDRDNDRRDRDGWRDNDRRDDRSDRR